MRLIVLQRPDLVKHVFFSTQAAAAGQQRVTKNNVTANVASKLNEIERLFFFVSVNKLKRYEVLEVDL